MNKRMQQFYMTLAADCATMSRAIRLQVGSVIVKDNNIISFSWNGTPAGWDNNCEDTVIENGIAVLKTKPEVLHAESNALMKLAKTGGGGQGASLFVTHSPCVDCAKMIHQAGIENVYYANEYRSVDGIALLRKLGIIVKQL